MTTATEARLASGTTITPENRADWLAERKSAIGASEAAAILGISPYTTPLEVFLRKRGLLPDVEESSAMRWGNRLERPILDAYAEDVGQPVEAFQVFRRHPYLPWMTATLDGVRSDGRIVEAKTADWRTAHLWGEAGTGDVPPHYAVQIQWQLAVTEGEVADLAVLIGASDFRVFTVEREPRIIARLIEAGKDFLRRLAEDDPPPPTLGTDARLYQSLYPDPEGEAELPVESFDDACLYALLGAEIGEKQRLRDMAKARLLAALGPAQVGRLADGRTVKRSIVEVKEHTVKASTQTRITISKGGK